jgi:hypothetical protein|nr:MAG TPA: DNA polymerase [Caudoviricetes sp.]
MERWVKLYDKFTEWEWFDSPKMVQLFVYLFIKASTVDDTYRSMEIKRGQVRTTQARIMAATGLSKQSLRTCLNRLKRTNEITVDSSHNCTLITILNYEKYQQTPYQSRTDEETQQPDPLPQDEEQPTPQTEQEAVASEQPKDTKNMTPEEKHEDGIHKKLLEDVAWQQYMCLRFKYTPQQLIEKTNEFFIDQRCRGTAMHRNVKEAKQHINNWIIVQAYRMSGKTGRDDGIAALTIEQRKSNFCNVLIPFIAKYGKETIRQFYDYWSEPDTSKKKMRFELQSTWDLPYRLERWAANDRPKKDTPGAPVKPTKKDIDIARQREAETQQRERKDAEDRKNHVSFDQYKKSTSNSFLASLTKQKHDNS